MSDPAPEPTSEPTAGASRPAAPTGGVASRILGLPSLLGDGCISRLDAHPLIEWLIAVGPHLDCDAFLPALAEQLTTAGLAVERMTIAVGSEHSTHAGFARFWQRGEGVRQRGLAYEERDTDLFQRSPFRHVYRIGRPLHLDLTTTPDGAFGVVPELKAAGLRHYSCYQLLFPDGRQNGVSFATAAPEGFGPVGLALIEAILPALTVLLELDVERWRLRTMLQTYVGRTPAARILSGDVRRDGVGRLRAALMFADMRDYSRLTADLEPARTVALLDIYFDCLVPSIRANGGEVLKYMGDGLLASFAVDEDMPERRATSHNGLVGNSRSAQRAVHGALGAARQGLAKLDALNRIRPCEFAIRAGFALHYGEAAYGNVGSQDRLDFTVVGPDVNLTSRIGRLNLTLGEPILMSEAFASLVATHTRDVGSHEIAGLSGSVRVHAPM